MKLLSNSRTAHAESSFETVPTNRPQQESWSPPKDNLTYHLSIPSHAREGGKKVENRETTKHGSTFPPFDVFLGGSLPKKSQREGVWRQDVGDDESRPRYPVVVVDDVVSFVAPALLISPFCPPAVSALSNPVGVGFSTLVHLKTTPKTLCTPQRESVWSSPTSTYLFRPLRACKTWDVGLRALGVGHLKFSPSACSKFGKRVFTVGKF